ncbi:serine/threonine-protein kinase [Frigoriglobus tundricola]|uniref:Protein kinase domain-containing protein n=1 Tax=Frigoriglobus tundricola TaxID=2774151 RepID=A0A6M5Z501_9BACT|nr:protein kinase [Frigoriglobus tundricola]QJX00877.1 hypothetical protein FTUN_8515 [Frigoriglobus tundricola]
MKVFFQCVAEAVAENGVQGLASLVPGAEYAFRIAQGTFQRYRQRSKDAEIRAEVRELAESSFEQARVAAVEAARGVAGRAPIEDRVELELFLSQIPGAVRHSLKRPEDVSGRTVPPNYALASPEDVLKILPARPLRFRPGDPLPALPGWSLVEPLGSGGFGEVWLARHRTTSGLSGAVKFCHGEHARALRHESALITRVMRAGKHKGIVPLLNAHLEGETPWLLFDYVDGGDLGELIRAAARLAPAARVQRATEALRQLCDALAHCHRQEPAIVHRDLKPSNILHDRAGKRLMVTDFGIGSVAARTALDEERRGATTAAGRLASYMRGAHTPLYSSPQQRQGEPPDPRDDVHALGVIGYQLLTAQLEHGPGPDFAEYLKGTGASEALIGLVGRCVAHAPERRPVDASDLLARLKELPAAGGVPATPAPFPSPVSDSRPVARPVAVPVRPAEFAVDAARCVTLLSQTRAVVAQAHEYKRDRFVPDGEPEADPIPEDLPTWETVRNVLLGVLVLGVMMTLFGVAVRPFLYIGTLVVLVFSGWLWFVVRNSPYRLELERRRRAFVAARRDLRTAEGAWESVRCEFVARDRELRQAITDTVAEVRGLAAKYRADLERVREAAERAAYERHMRGQDVTRAEIPGIGESRKQLLVAAGIASAHHVSRSAVLAVDGFGPALANAVVAWRDEVSRRFRFDPARDVPLAQLDALAARFSQLQTTLLARAEGHLAELVGQEPRVKKELSALVPDIREAIAEFELRRANLRLMERGNRA